jgi:hypothetical protein
LFDGLPNAADLVRRQIIHHHDIAGGEFGNEYLLDVSLNASPFIGPSSQSPPTFTIGTCCLSVRRCG